MAVRPVWGIDGVEAAGTDIRMQHSARMTPGVEGVGRARSGSLGKPVVVTAQTTPDMSVTVPPCSIEVAGPSFVGSLPITNDAPLRLTVGTSSPTNPRKDLVVARFIGEEVQTPTSRKCVIEIIPGVAATTPALPATPINGYDIAVIDVPKGATSISNANITNRLTQTTALGGITPSRNFADVAGVYPGQYRDRLDIGTPYLERWSGSRWEPFDNLRVSDVQGGPGVSTAPDPALQPYQLQFGQGVVNVVNTGGEAPLNFEKAFPNGCIGVFPQVIYDTEGDLGHPVSVAVRQVLKTGFVMQFFSRTGTVYGVGFGIRVSYIAVGW